MCHQPASYQDSPQNTYRRLLERISGKDQNALGDLYRETHSMAFSIAQKILHNREASEEAVQDAYVQIWRRAHTFDPGRGSPRAWIITIIRTRSLDRLRKLSRETVPDSQPEIGITGTLKDAERISLRFEANRRVRSALSRLRFEERTLIEHAYFGGLSHREMAAQMEIPLGTIKTRIRTGMQRLREILQPYQLADLLD